MDRNDIYIVSRHSNLNEETANMLLEKNVFNDAGSWKKFLHLFFIVLGVGFTVSGIIFFFAYNWDSLHKFAKMGILEALIVATILAALFFKSHIIVKKSILTGAAVLVGALFAVHGQIYQTGANAYDFFFAWTLAIAIWALVVNFAPLWLLFVTLANTTIVLYSEQVAPYSWLGTFVYLLLFILNIAVLFLFIFLSSQKKKIDFPVWFRNVLALACVGVATVGLINGIWSSKAGAEFIILLLSTIILYAMGIWYGKKIRSIFFYAIIAFSAVCFISALMLRASLDVGMFFFISILDIAGITVLIKVFFKIQKQWAEEASSTNTNDIQTTNGKNEK
jgi:uncharacterized membrane protein